MAMKFSRWNAPYDKVDPFGFAVDGQAVPRPVIGVFCQITWDSTAVSYAGLGPVAGQTYDVGAGSTGLHITTYVPASLAGFTPWELWGIRYVHQFLCPDGSSGANFSNSTALKTGKVAIQFSEVLQAFQIFVVGNSGAVDNLTPAQYLEGDNTIAGILAPLRFSGLLIGSN